MGLEFFQNLIPREFLLFHFSGGFLQDPTCKAAFILSKYEFTQCEQPLFLGWLSKTKQNKQKYTDTVV